MAKARYSKPFKVWTVALEPSDPTHGKRARLRSERKARKLAAEVVKQAGAKLDDVLRASETFYVLEHVAGRKWKSGGRGSRRINTECKTKFEAEAWLDKREGKPVRRGGAKLLAGSLDAWIADLEFRDRRPSTLRDYKSLAGMWKAAFGPVALDAIDPEAVERYFRDLDVRKDTTHRKEEEAPKPKGKDEDEEEPERTTAARTKNKHLVVLRSFFRWARERDLCEADPTARIRRWKEPSLAPRALEPEELRRLLAATVNEYRVSVAARRNVGGKKGGKVSAGKVPFEQPHNPAEEAPKLYAATVCGFCTLLRRGAVLALEWRDLDLGRGELHLRPELSKTATEAWIPLAASLRSALSEIPKGKPTERIFEGVSLEAPFRRAAKRAGLSGVSYHTLRKTGASLLLRAGIGFDVVQKLGGWSPGRNVLLAHYRHVSPEELRRAAEVLDRIVTGREASAPAATGDAVS